MKWEMTLAASCVFIPLLVTGCAGWKQTPVAQVDYAYFNQKIANSIPAENQVVALYFRGSTKELHIVLDAKKGNEAYAQAETNCLKVIKAMSNDPQIPNLDVVVISSQRIVDDQAATIGPVKSQVSVENGMVIVGMSSPQSEQITHEVLFCCRISRNDLLTGAAPEILIRNGDRAGGIMKGKSIEYISPIVY